MTNRLIISDDIQLFFRPDGSAWYSSRSAAVPEQIEGIVYRWQDENLDHPEFNFSEKWLQAYEAPDQRKKQILTELRGAYENFDKQMTRELLARGIPKHKADERVRKMVEVVIRKHNPELLPELGYGGMNPTKLNRASGL